MLGLEYGSTEDNIKKAYRRPVNQQHPDLGGSTEDVQNMMERNQLLLE